MHFRERAHTVQLIRTKYDPATKKAKSEIVGKLPKSNSNIPKPLLAALTAEEQTEVRDWIKGHGAVVRLQRELAARTLAEQLALAQGWFAEKKDEDARFMAATILQAWTRLRNVLKRNKLLD